MRITALIVTYNRLDKLKISIEATLALPFQHIVVVDNDSNDGTSDWLNTLQDPRLNIIRTPDNVGGSGGFKYGVRYLINNINTDWVVFYDDDAWPSASFIKNFENLNKRDSVVYCSKVIDKYNIICAMNIPWKKIPKSLSENIAYYKDKTSFCAGADERTDVLTFSFVGCIIPISVLEKTYELIREDLFIYFDDVFYSYQLSLQKIKIIYEPLLIIHHDVDSQGENKFPAWKVYYLMRNMIRSRFILGSDSFFSGVAMFLRALKYFEKCYTADNILLYLKYYFKGVWHGIKNVGGKNH
ncbi:hypothetical protein SAMN05518863_104439 [Candidatus Pantoea symbiotica]|jgi:GT2 family glycosyltransferase|uniref:Glycosyltransferase 2-like domain-containing protein n=1 Tax=Candidatus Pantoea symbiotica TaxID=1884370 RepID=A0A1I3WW66_9GAMM|nr:MULTISPECIES: glycosyltransferase [Pantoea]KAJ9432537.1 glycosyltransferase [Pantoea sp. YR343]SFK11758.1 hypothetical protein SAMN05518863_104439 [Pantoea symbiotica]SFU75920.1 hypothetical protein SAMN05518864_104439 [Pantoea sp. YR525]